MESYRVVFHPPKHVELEAVPVPKPGPGQILVRNCRSAISTGTELTMLMKEFPEGSVWDRITKPVTGSGYSSVGEIIEIGNGVEGHSVGERVLCGSNHCHFALQTPGKHLIKVPAGVNDDAAALYRLAEITMNGVRRGEPKWGECAVVFGLGIIGQFLAVFARLAGCRPVIGVDISPLRRELAQKMGADLVLDGHATDLAEQVKAANHGRMADVVYEATGLGDLIPKAMDLLRRQGRIVIVSSPRTKTLIDLHDYCNSPSFSIIGAHNSSHPANETPYNPFTTYRNLELYLDHIQKGDLDPTKLITHHFSWWEAPEAYRMLMEDRGKMGAVVLDWTVAKA